MAAGFGATNDDKKADSSDEAGKGAGSGSGPGKDSKDSGKDGDPKKKKKEFKKDGDGPQFDPIMLSLTGMVALYAAYLLFGSNRPFGDEISWQEFRNTYLATGMVDRLEVINKDYVRVYLRNTPNFAFIEGSSSSRSGSNGSSQGSGSSASSSDGSGDRYSFDRAADGSGAATDGFSLNIGADREAELHKALVDSKAHKALYFKVGSVESFERQLEDAQIDLRVRPRDFVLVRHVNETDVSSRLGSLLPYVLMFAVYAGVFKMMSGGGLGGGIGGGGGPGGINRMFSIGKAKPTVVNKDSKVRSCLHR